MIAMSGWFEFAIALSGLMVVTCLLVVIMWRWFFKRIAKIDFKKLVKKIEELGEL